jgi:hypothetical protein
MQIISAARLALMAAKTYYSYDSPFSELTAKKVDRHIHQSKLSDPARRIDEVDAVFLGMQTAIGYVPQGIILTADEPATMASGAYMFAFRGDIPGMVRTIPGMDCPVARSIFVRSHGL